MDLNSDLGEGFGAWHLGDDEALLDTVTSANVACGFHAGDPPTMRRVSEYAAPAAGRAPALPPRAGCRAAGRRPDRGPRRTGRHRGHRRGGWRLDDPVAGGGAVRTRDTPGAVAMARAVREALRAAGVRITPFTGVPV